MTTKAVNNIDYQDLILILSRLKTLLDSPNKPKLMGFCHRLIRLAD